MSESVRNHLFDQIEQTAGMGEVDTTSESIADLPESSMLMGFVCIAEWMDGSGNRWLTKISADANGKPGPPWQIKGYLHDILGPEWWEEVKD